MGMIDVSSTNDYAVSMSASSGGPDYTHFSGENRTIVDYVFVDSEKAQFLDSCYTHNMYGLNSYIRSPSNFSCILIANLSVKRKN